MTGQTDHLDPILYTLLRDLEDYMGFELCITSGQRTVEHNADPKVGGVANSEHTYLPDAKGADVMCKQSGTRFKMLKWLFMRGVRRIGIGNVFIHIGVADDKPQDVTWHYY